MLSIKKYNLTLKKPYWLKFTRKEEFNQKYNGIDSWRKIGTISVIGRSTLNLLMDAKVNLKLQGNQALISKIGINNLIKTELFQISTKLFKLNQLLGSQLKIAFWFTIDSNFQKLKIF